MSDDIVARLRVLASEFPTVNGWMDNEWKNAADEIERLRNEIRQYARVRAEYCAAWSKWIDEHDKLPAAEWCRAYADAMPYPNPDGPDVVRMIHARLDSRHRIIADEIERMRELSGEAGRLRDERDQARREVCAFVSGRFRKDCVTLDRMAAIAEAWQRGWDCFPNVATTDKQTPQT